MTQTFIPVILTHIPTAYFGLFTPTHLQIWPSRIRTGIYDFIFTLHERLKSQTFTKLVVNTDSSSNVVAINL